MKILTQSDDYEAKKQAREPLGAADCYAAAIALLEAEADRLRSEFEKAAAQAASPYHVGGDNVRNGFKAQELLEAAAWLREQRHSAERSNRRDDAKKL